MPDFRPAPVGAPRDVGGICGKGVAAFLAVEQIKPLSRDQPEIRVTRHRNAARNVDRIVSAELRTVDVRMGDKRSPIAFIPEAPDYTGLESLELLPAEFGLSLGEIGDRIEAVDGKARESIQHHALSDRGVHRKRQADQDEQNRRQSDQGISWAPTFSFLPWCRHS